MDATLAPPRSAAALLPGWIGAAVLDAEGTPVGRVADVLFDTRTLAPGWLLVALEQGHALVPARGLRHRARGIQLAATAERIRTAPAPAAAPDALAHADALRLAEHFGVRCGAGPWLGATEPAVARVVAGVPVAS